LAVQSTGVEYLKKYSTWRHFSAGQLYLQAPPVRLILAAHTTVTHRRGGRQTQAERDRQRDTGSDTGTQAGESLNACSRAV
jgi:hypothetical protein